MANHTRAWGATYETLPPDSGEAASVGASRIRNLKVDIRERMVVDHAWNDNTTTGSEDGEHTKVTLEQRSNPTQVADRIILFAKDVSSVARLHVMDETGTASQIPEIISGSHVTTLTGFSGTVSATFNWRLIGGICTLWTNAQFSGTSNSNQMSIADPLPAVIRPSVQRDLPCIVLSGSSRSPGSVILSTNGYMTFGKLVRYSDTDLNYSILDFISSGVKGLTPGFSITYAL